MYKKSQIQPIQHMISKRLDKLPSVNIDWHYTTSNIKNLYDYFGDYVIFYYELTFDKPTADWREIVNPILSDEFTDIDLIYADKMFQQKDVYNIKTYYWEPKYKLDIQIAFNYGEYFKKNKSLILSKKLKTLIREKSGSEFD